MRVSRVESSRERKRLLPFILILVSLADSFLALSLHNAAVDEPAGYLSSVSSQSRLAALRSFRIPFKPGLHAIRVKEKALCVRW